MTVPELRPASQSLGPGRAKGRGKDGPQVKGSGHGPMWGPTSVQHFGAFPEGGGYPKMFVRWAYAEMEREYGFTVDPATVLHLCSGSMLTGIRVDIRASTTPDIVADCRSVPLPDGSQTFIMADPPYSPEYARNLYDTEASYPKPGQILKESARLLAPGGYIGLLHHQVPVFRRPLKMVKVYAVHRGLGFGLVAWSLFRKEDIT